jgi:hypothetical protein
VRGERNLMRPVAVNRGFAEFASSVDHGHPPHTGFGRRPRSRDQPGEGGAERSRSMRAALKGVGRVLVRTGRASLD